MTVLQGVVSFRIGHIHTGMHSLLPKRQRIDSPENITWFVMARSIHLANKAFAFSCDSDSLQSSVKLSSLPKIVVPCWKCFCIHNKLGAAYHSYLHVPFEHVGLSGWLHNTSKDKWEFCSPSLHTEGFSQASYWMTWLNTVY